MTVIQSHSITIQNSQVALVMVVMVVVVVVVMVIL